MISSSVYGYPKDQALKVAVDTITEFLIEHDMLVYNVVFDKSAFQISEKLFCRHCHLHHGELIKALYALFGKYRYIGYDISDEMLSVARENVPSTEFYSDWNEVKADFTDSLLNISSTLHEVYSYSSQEEIEKFWLRVFESGFKYVAIRDMMLSGKSINKYIQGR